MKPHVSPPFAWQAACEDYCANVSHTPDLPRAKYFAGFGALHIAVAELIYERSAELLALDTRRVVHIESALGLIAVFSPAQRMVQLRADHTALGQTASSMDLNLRIMPISASLLEGALAKAFHACPSAALCWHYGQASLAALDHIPALTKQQLSIKRFPSLEPAALLLRQLRLIHLLSHHTPSFEQLLALLHEDDRAFVCPDLASLYLTGTLRVSKA